MNKTTLFALTLSISLTAQIYSQDTTIVDFETLSPMIEIDTSDTTNIWQIGHPDKEYFHWAYSGQKAIVTDTANDYPKNCNSSFIFKIDSQHTKACGINISFWHKFDTDNENDFGQVEFSLNGGSEWYILNDTSFWDGYGYWQHFDTTGNYIKNGKIIIANHSNGWILSRYEWIWYFPVKAPKDNDDPKIAYKSANDINPDSIYIRFRFVSDSVENENSGWMIDNIEISGIYLHDISEKNIDKNIQVAYNATNKTFAVQITDDESFKTYALYNINGQKLFDQPIKTDKFEFSVAGYKKGIYFITFQGENNKVTKKIIIE